MRPPPVMVLGVALLTTSALAVAGCGTRIGTTTSRNTYTITEPVTSLKIDNPVGNTQIEGTDTNTISVTEELSYSGNPPQTSYPITGGGHLTLSYTCPGVFDVNSCSVTYLVKVPRRLAVQVDGKVGSTTLTGLAGQLTLSSSTGNIDATGLTSATVTARANAGTITPGIHCATDHRGRTSRGRLGYGTATRGHDLCDRHRQPDRCSRRESPAGPRLRAPHHCPLAGRFGERL
jgi:hypothetical protein